MGGPYGNDNSPFVRQSQFVTFGAAADESAAFKPTTQQISLFTTSLCWVKVGGRGETPVATIPGAEKTVSESFPVPASTWVDVAVPEGTDEKPITLSVIDDGTTGTLYILERSDS
jgi:hypothetical protein